MSKIRAIRVILSIVAGIFSLSLALDSWASSCGDSFHGPGHFTLNSDVGPCSGPNFAIEVHGPATLDMAGHIVSCDGNPSSIGIFILGDNVTVKGGTVFDCGAGFAGGNSLTNNTASNNHVGFLVSGDKGKLKGNTASGNFTGFEISGDSNTLDGNLASSNAEDGFDISGDKDVTKSNSADMNGSNGFTIAGGSQTLSKNLANRNGGNGFEITGTHTKLTSNRAINNSFSGFLVGDDDNTLSHNTATTNEIDGIVIPSPFVGNKITNNKATGNTVFDLQDTNDECTSNNWKKNTFVTKDPACIK